MKIVPGALFVVLAAGPIACGPASADEPTVGRRPRAVVELFTSQGCANCPPADAFLAELSADPELVTLSFPVDYWDYLGWKDTAAKPEFTRRQRAYAARRGGHDVYTPQVIVNGAHHTIGSDRAGIGREIGPTGPDTHRLPVSVDLSASGNTLVVDIGNATGEAAPATVWIVRYEIQATIPIRRGENTGRVLTYAHLVRALQPIGMWKGHALRIELPRQEVAGDGGIGCAVLVQTDRDGALGPIVGARVIETRPRG